MNIFLFTYQPAYEGWYGVEAYKTLEAAQEAHPASYRLSGCVADNGLREWYSDGNEVIIELLVQ